MHSPNPHSIPNLALMAGDRHDGLHAPHFTRCSHTHEIQVIHRPALYPMFPHSRNTGHPPPRSRAHGPADGWHLDDGGTERAVHRCDASSSAHRRGRRDLPPPAQASEPAAWYEQLARPDSFVLDARGPGGEKGCAPKFCLKIPLGAQGGLGLAT
eukprot:366060-Chlamydomonas_euryale.AAC.8